MTTNYEAAFKAAMTAAKDILRTQMAGRVLERIEKAKGEVTAAIRAYADIIRNQNKAKKARAEEDTKRNENRDAFTQAFGEIEGVDAADLEAARAAVDAERAESDKNREEEDKQRSEAEQKSRDAAKKRIEDAKAEVARLTTKLDDVHSGKEKVNKDELKTLANELVEKSLTENSVDSIVDASEEERTTASA